MAYTVDFYLNRYTRRVETICQFESARRGLDYNVILRRATEVARNTQDSYRDDFGTSGFVKWFTLLTSDLCRHYHDNRDEYVSLLGKKKTQEIPTKATPPQPAEKICVRCKYPKPITEFYKNKSAKDGMASWCKPCTLEVARQSVEKKKKIKESDQMPTNPIETNHNELRLILSNEDIEAIIAIYSKKLEDHIKQSGIETERLTTLVQKWIDVLSKRKPHVGQ